MYNEGTPDFTVDQGMYYPTATNYGYYCTGYESPAEWEDHHRIFGADGQDIQYAVMSALGFGDSFPYFPPHGVQTEGLPYVYYIPNYGYAQSQHNPYNPHIPGAVVGIDGPYFGTQQYYPLSPYQEPMSSPAYAPVIVQPDFASNTSLEPLMDTHVPFSHGTEGNSKSGFASSSAFFPRNPPKPAPSQSKLLNRMFDGSRANIGPNKHSVSQRDSSSGSYLTPTMTHGLQSRGASGSRQTVDNISNRNVLSQSKQLHIATPVSDVYSKFGSSAHRVDKNQTKYLASRPQSSVIASVDSLGEKNRGPRTNNSKIQLPGKAYVAKTGKNNAQGDTVIRTDQYNKDDFPVDYVFAKFFVIKSYSEDDVHKSIKYNVWSSTPNGNRKLQSAYEESQEISSEKHGACPVFLFFSVNASGQFCGVAEMIGPVDFHKDMGFWQQDKWSGSFPVKWHILKDVPNNNFRHIILENNENKPVTNSRDTQEIMYKQGLEMLMIFKNHPLTTSVLNDFMYYENRQKIMQEEKARKNNYIKSVHTPFLLPAVGATILGQHVQQPSTSVANGVEQKDSDNLKKSDLGQHVERRPLKLENHMERTPIKILKKSDKSDFRLVSSTSHSNNSNTERVTSDETRAEGEGGITSALKIGLLDINPRPAESASSPNVTAPVFISEDVNIVNVGSMPIKLNGFTEPTKPHTISSIPLDLRELQLGKSGTSPT